MIHKLSTITVAVAVLTAAFCTGAQAAALSTAARSLPPLDLSATPTGWVPVAYGEAQISVPSNWNAGYGTACDIAHDPGSVFVGRTGYGLCPEYVVKGVPVVYLAPESSGKPSTGRRAIVNGLVVTRVIHNSFESLYLVPALGVELTLVGTKAQRVLSTLTISPRAVVFEQRATSTVPASWRTDSFDGISFSVPANWSIYRTKYAMGIGESCGPTGVALDGHDLVLLSTDESPFAPGCPRIFTQPEQPRDGIHIDRGPLAPTVSVKVHTCLKLHGLTACPGTDYPYSILVFKVTVASSKPVVVSIGLAGTGVTARTILNSLRPTATGTVWGHIQRCSALSEPMSYVGGSVVALRGVVRWRKVSKLVWKRLLPTDVVGREQVPAGGEYRFTLPAGDYVIDLPHYIGGNVGTLISVVIRAGRTIHADLPNDCR